MIANSFSRFINSLSQNFVPVIGGDYSMEAYTPVDLSINNKKLAAIDVTSSQDFERYIHRYLESKSAKLAYGGYNEKRGIYRRSIHFNQQNPETERNIHLGLDIWIHAGTKVLVPLSGKVHSFQNNNNFGDYGPTIILEHEKQGVCFYTLYGHLSLASIQNIKKGQSVETGDVLGFLGDASVNGDYAPHLHFQIIEDLQGNVGDYPGVSNKKDLRFFLQNCPDPNLLLKIFK